MILENRCRPRDGEYSARASDAEKGCRDSDVLHEGIGHTKAVASREYTIWLSIGYLESHRVKLT